MQLLDKEKLDIVNIPFSRKKVKKTVVITLSVIISLFVLYFGYNGVIYFLMEVPFVDTTDTTLDAQEVVDALKQQGFDAEIDRYEMYGGIPAIAVDVPLRQLGDIYKAHIPVDISKWDEGYTGISGGPENYSSFREYMRLCGIYIIDE